jgi:hypothetical protein
MGEDKTMTSADQFEGEILAVGAVDMIFLQQCVASSLKAQGASLEWGEQTRDIGILTKKDILPFAFSLAVGLASNVAANAIYDEIKKERPSATLLTNGSTGCIITVGKSSIYLSASTPQEDHLPSKNP